MKTITLVVNGLTISNVAFEKIPDLQRIKLSYIKSGDNVIGTADFRTNKLVRWYKTDEDTNDIYKLTEVKA